MIKLNRPYTENEISYIKYLNQCDKSNGKFAFVFVISILLIFYVAVIYLFMIGDLSILFLTISMIICSFFILLPVLYFFKKYAALGGMGPLYEVSGKFHTKNKSQYSHSSSDSTARNSYRLYFLGEHSITMPRHWYDFGYLVEGESYICECIVTEINGGTAFALESNTNLNLLSLNKKYFIDKEYPYIKNIKSFVGSKFITIILSILTGSTIVIYFEEIDSSKGPSGIFLSLVIFATIGSFINCIRLGRPKKKMLKILKEMK